MKIILTGATGYVGEGVMLELLRTLHACLYPRRLQTVRYQPAGHYQSGKTILI